LNGIFIIAFGPNVTGFAKKGLPYTSNSFYHLLTHVGPHYHPNFNTITVYNLKLRIVKVGKLDVCEDPFHKFYHKWFKVIDYDQTEQ